MIDPKAKAILDLIATLYDDDPSILENTYNIRRIEPQTLLMLNARMTGDGDVFVSETAPLDAAIYAWLDAGKPVEMCDVHAPTFDRMESALSTALGEVPVEDPPEGETSWDGLLERVRRLRDAAANGATVRASVLAHPNLAHVTVDTDVALLRRTVLAAGRRQIPPRAQWSVVSALLSHGSGVSWAICKALGLDPDEIVGTMPDEDEE